MILYTPYFLCTNIVRNLDSSNDFVVGLNVVSKFPYLFTIQNAAWEAVDDKLSDFYVNISDVQARGKIIACCYFHGRGLLNS